MFVCSKAEAVEAGRVYGFCSSSSRGAGKLSSGGGVAALTLAPPRGGRRCSDYEYLILLPCYDSNVPKANRDISAVVAGSRLY